MREKREGEKGMVRERRAHHLFINVGEVFVMEDHIQSENHVHQEVDCLTKHDDLFIYENRLGQRIPSQGYRLILWVRSS